MPFGDGDVDADHAKGFAPFKRDAASHYTGHLESRVLIDSIWVQLGNPTPTFLQLRQLIDYANQVTTPVRIDLLYPEYLIPRVDSFYVGTIFRENELTVVDAPSRGDAAAVEDALSAAKDAFTAFANETQPASDQATLEERTKRMVYGTLTVLRPEGRDLLTRVDVATGRHCGASSAVMNQWIDAQIRAARPESRTAPFLFGDVISHEHDPAILASLIHLEGEPPTEALAAEVGRRLHPASDRETGEIEAQLLLHVDQIRAWLTPAPTEKRGLRLTKVHQLLTRTGVTVPYSSLHRFVVKHCGFGARGRITVRMADVAPGDLAEIDFGRLGLVHDPVTNRRRLAWALLVVLPASRHQYVHVTFAQTVTAVIHGLEDAWAFFGGVTRRVVLDNLRAAITKADRYDPIFQRTMEEYARHRGFVLDPAPVRTPTGKPHVERGVPYLRENFFRGETWRDLAHVQASVITWVRETAGTRIHGTTRQRPLGVFENVERATLLPLVAERFDPPRWAQCSVHPDHHISFGKALYFVPTRFLRQRVWVRGDTRLVRIYADRELIKTHATQPPGGRATDHADYPEALTAYTRRDPQRIIHQAASHGLHVGRFATALLAGTFPWAKLRQAQRLLRPGDKYGWTRVDGACQRALAFELLNVKRVETILRLDLDPQRDQPDATSPTGEARVYPLRPRFARPDTSFAHASVTPTEPSTPLHPSQPAPEISNERSEIVS